MTGRMDGKDDRQRTKPSLLYKKIKANMSVCVSHDVLRFNMAEPAGSFQLCLHFQADQGKAGQGQGSFQLRLHFQAVIRGG